MPDKNAWCFFLFCFPAFYCRRRHYCRTLCDHHNIRRYGRSAILSGFERELEGGVGGFMIPIGIQSGINLGKVTMVILKKRRSLVPETGFRPTLFADSLGLLRRAIFSDSSIRPVTFSCFSPVGPRSPEQLFLAVEELLAPRLESRLGDWQFTLFG
ncbi:hypothetical protein BDP81DRAFT_69019 [Colletotrichum phormii]|uniref:Uncharacterized protein n=1 Tax=Colletotrichum phormii TaxID=359342 RepID=A0AAI9ZMG8_9PEZI|nr:uncharacterized protein BDP81DRAFT_69019 [Colletotrichum phormii]KAK1633633.1 hypothetical protein BDP81DRAFT_69019 [Colletotrichum phormii]